MIKWRQCGDEARTLNTERDAAMIDRAIDRCTKKTGSIGHTSVISDKVLYEFNAFPGRRGFEEHMWQRIG